MSDWDLGTYEYTASDLAPVAGHVADLAEPLAGLDVLDVACGTGNAAILAAKRGARVVGVDLGERLLDVARALATQDGLEIDFRVGDARALPVDADAFDLVISTFGVIFAAPAEAAVAEIARVVRPGGRAIITSWLPAGPIFQLIKLARRAAPPARTTGPAPADWGNRDAIRALFAPHRAELEFAEQQVEFRADSPREAMERDFEHHPMRLAAKPQLTPAAFEDLKQRSIALAEELTEDPPRFLATSPYLITTARF